MTRRTTPDPRFAAAARDELQARVRRAAAVPEQRPVRPPRRRGPIELVAAVAVVLIAAAVLVGVQHVRGTVEGEERPAVSAVPSDTATAPAPAPTMTSPAPSPTPTSARALIGPTGAERRTDAEIRAFAAQIGNSDVWGEQAVLDAHCMAEKGFLYDPVWNYHHGTQLIGLSAAQAKAYSVAEDGPETDQPYDWRTAGCHGRSVHLTGQDHAN